jgi:hypothetical protein
MVKTSRPLQEENMPIPPLAGLASYAQAAQLGYSVEENVQRLLRYAWFEKQAMETGLYWLASTPEWEVKEALGLHLSLDAEHAAQLRRRISEMRNPAPRMDVSPDLAIDRFFDELHLAESTAEKIAGLYGVLRPAMLQAYQQHFDHASPLIDYPTRYVLKHMLLDQDEVAAWGALAVQAMDEMAASPAEIAAWKDHLRAYLQAAGGVMGDQDRTVDLPPSRLEGRFEPDFFPRRDERFAMRWNFTNPQRPVSLDESVPLDERTLALMCRRIVEMDVPEYMTRIIALATDEPWEYYVAMTRQLWDEVRHAMLGTIYFEDHAVDWKKTIAIHPGMAIRLGRLPFKDAHLVLYAIEQNLMPGNTGKRLEYEISKNAHDVLAARIQDYDWADEVLHVHIGREWLLPRLGMKPTEAVEKGWQLRGDTLDALKEFEERGEQFNWWPAFVRQTLGRETAKPDLDTTRL